MAANMEDFVNWDNPTFSPNPDLLPISNLPAEPSNLVGSFHDPDLDLAFENVNGDDFSFWALEHYGVTASPTDNHILQQDLTTPHGQSSLPHASCSHDHGRHQQVHRDFPKGITDTVWPTQTMPNPVLDTAMPPQIQASLKGSLNAQENLQDGGIDGQTSSIAPKIGARFSRDSVRILKTWLTTHPRKPYPTEEEKELLQQQTGLNRTQISNWLANARRRGKVQRTRSISPNVNGSSTPIEIPQRRGTPALEQMNPLQRWQNSPPEHEPASASAIASAIRGSNSSRACGLDSPRSHTYTDDGSGLSMCKESSASSWGNSGSSNQSGRSAYSHQSRHSLGSLGSGRGRRRRRKAIAAQSATPGGAPFFKPLKTYQCTFCTATFKNKFDWQRHEKELHLALERWICSPQGPHATQPATSATCCAFCGQANPDNTHFDTHNVTNCQERAVEERTFYRKDHLRQHLKLVHGAKFLPWAMESWKVAMPPIRSRCGFCGAVLTSWQARTDHVAEHFKCGASMATWRGDWGFDAHILHLVENSMPPYLIHEERSTPNPFTATEHTAELPRNAYELIKYDLVYFIGMQVDATGNVPTDQDLHIEACRVILGPEKLARGLVTPKPSWLKDLLMSSPHVTAVAREQPVRGEDEGIVRHLKINGKADLFDNEPFEEGLAAFVQTCQSAQIPVTNAQLQGEACKLVSKGEDVSVFPSEEVSNFIYRLICQTVGWLAPFRQRMQLPLSTEEGVNEPPADTLRSIDVTYGNQSRLASRLAELVRSQAATGRLPDDKELRKQARVIVYGNADTLYKTPADSNTWLSAFKQRYVEFPAPTLTVPVEGSSRQVLAGAQAAVYTINDMRSDTVSPDTPSKTVFRGTPYAVSGCNCYRKVERELGRYVASIMSPNNPNQHVPTDTELQHQARWIIYEDGDPWNKTSADNAEWLRRFKRTHGIISTGPGLYDDDGSPWESAPSLSQTAFTSPSPGAIEAGRTQPQQAGSSLSGMLESSPTAGVAVPEPTASTPDFKVQITEEQLDDILSEFTAITEESVMV